MRGRVAGAIFVAILVVFEVNCNDVKQFSASKLTELVEVKTTDDQGNVKARVVARSVPSNNDDSEGAGADDEDSKSTSEGSGDTNSDHFQTAVFNDQPMNVFDNGSSTASVISPSPSPTITAAKQTSSTMTNVAATKIRSSPSSNSTIASTKSTPRSSIKSPTSSESIAIEPARTITSTQVSSSTSVTESPTSMSTEVTTQPKTTVKATTGEPSTTSDEIPTSQLNVNKPTTESSSIIINGTGEPVVITKNTSKNSTVSTEVKISPVKPTTKSTVSSVNVHAHQDPTEKPRKTLFGFVTVEILIALLAGALFSILLVAFLVYRLKKRNEGSYELSETIALRPKELDEMGTNKEVFV